MSDLERSVEFYHHVLARLGYRSMDEVGAGAPCWGIKDADGSCFTIALKKARSGKRLIKHDRYEAGQWIQDHLLKVSQNAWRSP